MLSPDPSALLRKMNHYCTKALESAAGSCMSRGHYEVTVEHFLFELVQDVNADIRILLFCYNIDHSRFISSLQRLLEKQRTGNTGRPVFSPMLINWLKDSWMLGSIEHKITRIRSGVLFTTLILQPSTYTAADYTDQLSDIPRDDLRKKLPTLCTGSHEEESVATSATTTTAKGSGQAPTGAHSRGADTALGQFTIDFTAQAAAGELDPVIGRENEIRQCIDVLARRRKNNPIIVGEAGTGKTALVEGIAQRIVAKEVPAKLANVDILGLDLGLLQAGAGVKGEFENRLKSVIEEVQSSEKPIILFIDEAHTLIGAGGAAGSGDAANLLKPALARGELRTLAATTWSEYKKYFEKDPALTRRFQLIKCDEPDEETAIAMMRGLAPHYEKGHGIRISDDAVKAAVELSSRYISGRQLPDKAVDLLDTCAARVAIAQDAKPPSLQDLERQMQILGREESALAREADENGTHTKRLNAVKEELIALKNDAEALEKRWDEERKLVVKLAEKRSTLKKLKSDEETEGDEESLKREIESLKKELAEKQVDDTLVPIDVTEDLVAAVVSDWTGIPIGKMVKDEAETLLDLETKLGDRIKGQKSALKVLGEEIRSAKLGLSRPETPIGVFLLVGPSGVGKTETALSLADLLFGGERFIVTINMSEFQEKHTVSRLIGSPPGYVGYGEGGVLTEGVRQRPYSVVLLDEVEKADPEVMNLFYQVFDKGQLSDGEGRVIDFRNTIIMMTSNLASDQMTQMCMQVPPPKKKDVLDAITPTLRNYFKPALLARMNVVPFFPLGGSAMMQIVELKMNKLKAQIRERHDIELEVGSAVLEQIVARCEEVESGARNIDHIMSKTLLPLLSQALLGQMAANTMPSGFRLDLDEQGEFELIVTVDEKNSD